MTYGAKVCAEDTDLIEKFVFIPFQAESQKIVSGVNISRSFVGSLISTVVLLFVGPWSDCSGRRKPLLIMPLVGMSVMTTGVLLLLTFPGATTAQLLYVVQIPMSLGGNFGLLLAAAFSHIGDVSVYKLSLISFSFIRYFSKIPPGYPLLFDHAQHYFLHNP